MEIKTIEQLQEQRKEVGLAFLVKDNVSKEVIIDTIPYLSEGTSSYNKQSGNVIVFDRDNNKVSFNVEMNKPIASADIRTEPKEGTDVERFPRNENPTLEDINKAIVEFDETREERQYESFPYELSNNLRFLSGIGEIEFVEDFGGEGQGDHAHVVFKVANKFYKIDGFYSSWEGTEWEDEAYQVEAKQVMSTEYTAVKKD